MRVLNLLLLSSSIALLAAAPAPPPGAIVPIILTGPSAISTSRAAVLVKGKITFYNYTVTLNQTPDQDQVIDISDSAGILGYPPEVTVPAGHLSQSFHVHAFATGETTLTASNANGFATEDILVTDDK